MAESMDRTEQGSEQTPEGGEERGEVGTVPFCDAEKQVSAFRLDRGKWAGQIWVAHLKCCENPLCHCANVDFYCLLSDAPEHAPELHFILDPIKRQIVPDDDRTRPSGSADLAEALVAEMSGEIWQQLYQYLLTRKRKAIREMDVAKLPSPASPDFMPMDGRMVPFAEIFPFAEGFEFDLDGERWMADDQYCVMPDCECREVVLNFLHLAAVPDGTRTVKKPHPAAGYDYKLGKIRRKIASTAGDPSLETLVSAVLKAHPSFCRDVELRHHQLKALCLRVLLQAGPGGNLPGKTIVRDGPKVGRNDPCPCGSGKKYKKCCGNAGGAA